MGAVITSFIHYKFEINPPLFLQCLLNPLNFFKNPLTKIYIFGQKDHPRPFKDSNPLAALLQPQQPEQQQGQQQEQQQQQEEQSEAVEASEASDSVHEADRDDEDDDVADKPAGGVDLD